MKCKWEVAGATLIPRVELCREAVMEYPNTGSSRNNPLVHKVRSHLACLRWTIEYNSDKGIFRYTSPDGLRRYLSLRQVCLDLIKDMKEDELLMLAPQENRSSSAPPSSDVGPQIKRPSSSAEPDQNPAPTPSTTRSQPHNLLSLLIRNGLLKDGAKIKYCSFSDPITFKPFANLFLGDGSSVLDSLRQLLIAIKTKNSQRMININGAFSLDGSDNICSVCYYGGTIMLCDRCPSAYHHRCIGLSSIPEGEWICPSCKCKICNKLEYPRPKAWEHDDFVLTCNLCACKFHAGCITQVERKVVRMEGNSYKWFCNDRCERVFSNLDELSGKTYFTGPDNLTWTLLKPMEGDHLDNDDPLMPTFVVNQSKLHVAFGLLQECFAPILEEFTGQDLLEGVIFNHASDLRRLNFQGFHTITIERDESLLAVATFRVRDEVAELPFIATSLTHRRQGVGRMMMNKIEELLRLGGVERLILPAAPALLQMWTSKFGFKVMTGDERLQYLHYNFVSFQKTVLCYKLIG